MNHWTELESCFVRLPVFQLAQHLQRPHCDPCVPQPCIGSKCTFDLCDRTPPKASCAESIVSSGVVLWPPPPCGPHRACSPYVPWGESHSMKPDTPNRSSQLCFFSWYRHHTPHPLARRSHTPGKHRLSSASPQPPQGCCSCQALASEKNFPGTADSCTPLCHCSCPSSFSGSSYSSCVHRELLLDPSGHPGRRGSKTVPPPQKCWLLPSLYPCVHTLMTTSGRKTKASLCGKGACFWMCRWIIIRFQCKLPAEANPKPAARQVGQGEIYQQTLASHANNGSSLGKKRTGCPLYAESIGCFIQAELLSKHVGSTQDNHRSSSKGRWLNFTPFESVNVKMWGKIKVTFPHSHSTQ